jgi:hypothetical protein
LFIGVVLVEALFIGKVGGGDDRLLPVFWQPHNSIPPTSKALILQDLNPIRFLLTP